MDSTQINHTASKLPIKRKTHDTAATQAQSRPHVSPSPPFKFQRVWSEHDEIRFLQGLLDSSSDGLSFPRDLSIFYDRFTNSMSQPYTKSQLYEKLRRLKKKFQAVTCRISKGLDPSKFSAHDRELYEMSRRLWHDEFADMSLSGKVVASNLNSGVGGVVGKSGLVGVRVDFSPTLPVASDHDGNLMGDNEFGDEGSIYEEHKETDGFSKTSEANVIESNEGLGKQWFDKLSEVNVETEGEKNCETSMRKGSGLGQVVANAVMSAFDECLEDLRRKIDAEDGGKECFWVRWQRLKLDECDVFARRLRLVLEDVVRKQ